MIVSFAFASIALTGQWFLARGGGWNAPEPYYESGWDEYDSSVPALCVDLPNELPLKEWLHENFSTVILIQKEERARAHGFINAVRSQNRENELLAIIKDSSDSDSQFRALAAMAGYLYRQQDAQELSTKFLKEMAVAVVDHVIEAKSSNLLDDLFQRVSYRPAQFLIDEMTKRLFQTDPPLSLESKAALVISGRGLERWISSTHPEIFLKFLKEVSLPLMIYDHETWDARINYPLQTVIRTYTGRSEASSEAYLETYFQLTLVNPAIQTMEGRILALAYFSNNHLRPEEEASLLELAYTSTEHRVQLLSYELIRRATPEAFDILLAKCPEDLKECGRIFDIFFDRNQLSPGSLARIQSWFKDPRAKPLDRVFDSLKRWGESADALLPQALGYYDSTSSRGQYDGLAGLVAKRNLREVLEVNLLTKDQFGHLIDALAFSKNVPLTYESAQSIWSLLHEPRGLYDPDKDRRLTNALIGYFNQRAKEASDLELETLIPIVQQMFALPPDRTTDEVLLPLIRQMNDRMGERFPELKKMIDEMK